MQEFKKLPDDGLAKVKKLVRDAASWLHSPYWIPNTKENLTLHITF